MPLHVLRVMRRSTLSWDCRPAKLSKHFQLFNPISVNIKSDTFFSSRISISSLLIWSAYGQRCAMLIKGGPVCVTFWKMPRLTLLSDACLDAGHDEPIEIYIFSEYFRSPPTCVIKNNIGGQKPKCENPYKWESKRCGMARGFQIYP